MTSLYATGASGLRTQQARLDTVANNLANLGTTGFKAARVDPVDLPQQPLEVARARDATLPATEIGEGVEIGGITRSFEPGGPQPTGNPLDLAILGSNTFFAVSTPDGQTLYTRDGRFRPDAAGQLVTQTGDRLTPPITLPSGATVTEVTADGRVFAALPEQDPVEVGRIRLARFANPQGLAAAGQNRFAATVASGPPQIGDPGAGGFPALQGGALEASDVDLAEQMTTLIEAQRAYTVNARSIQTLDEMVGMVIQTRT